MNFCIISSILFSFIILLNRYPCLPFISIVQLISRSFGTNFYHISSSIFTRHVFVPYRHHVLSDFQKDNQIFITTQTNQMICNKSLRSISRSNRAAMPRNIATSMVSLQVINVNWLENIEAAILTSYSKWQSLKFK